MNSIITKIHKEIQLFINAASFLTIIPIKIHHKENIQLGKASFYFPIIGYIIGTISYISFYISNFLLPQELALFIAAIIVPIVIEGGLHKDGLADFFDAFTLSKHRTKTKILDIMKDHSLGSYGSLALICVILVQFISLKNIGQGYLDYAIILAHGTSRLVAISFIYTHKYARNTKNTNKGEIWTLSLKELIILITIAIIPIIIIFKDKGLFIIISVIVLWLYLARLLNKRIQGYTGDTLGAAKELTESLFYINIAIIT